MKKHARVEKIDEIIDHFNAPAHKIETLKCIGIQSNFSEAGISQQILSWKLSSQRVVIALIPDTSCHSATVIRCKTYEKRLMFSPFLVLIWIKIKRV
jgi:hypothetical protein